MHPNFTQSVPSGVNVELLTQDTKRKNSLTYRNVATGDEYLVPNIHYNRPMEVELENLKFNMSLNTMVRHSRKLERALGYYAITQDPGTLGEHKSEAEHYLQARVPGLLRDPVTGTYRAPLKSNDVPSMYLGALVFSDFIREIQEAWNKTPWSEITISRSQDSKILPICVYDLIGDHIPDPKHFNLNDYAVALVKPYLDDMIAYERSQRGNGWAISTAPVRRRPAQPF